MLVEPVAMKISIFHRATKVLWKMFGARLRWTSMAVYFVIMVGLVLMGSP